MQKLWIWAWLLTMGLAGSGCRDLNNLGELDATPEFAVPILYTSANVQDILATNSELVTILPDGNIRIRYEGSGSSRSANSIFQVIQLGGFTLTDSLTSAPFQPPNNVDVYKVLLKSGSVTFQFESNLMEDVLVTATIPQMKKNGVPFKVTSLLDYKGSVPVSSFVFPVDVSGYQLSSTNDSLVIRYDARNTKNERILLSKAAMAFFNLNFSYVEGFWGNEYYNIDRDTITIDIYDNWKKGKIDFLDPRIYVSVENSFGFPNRSKLDVFRVNTIEQGYLDLESPFVEQGIDFLYPDLNMVGQTVATNFVFDKTNSNIDQIFNAQPFELDYDIDVIANAQNDPSVVGFMTDSSKYAIRVAVEMEMVGNAEQFETEKVLDVNLGNLDRIKEGEFKLVSENELPLSAQMQLVFLDEQGQQLDSLFSTYPEVVSAAPVNADGIATQSVRKETFIPISGQKLESLKKTRKMLVRTAFSTTDQGKKTVRVLADQDIHLKLGLRAKVKY